jgi:hypothetical protein
MFVIIGWAKEVKEIGPAIVCHCYRCQRKRTWEHWKEIEWVKLYFIKIVPFIYKTYVVCEGCREPIQLDWVRWRWLGDRNRWQHLAQFIEDRQLAQKTEFQRNFLLAQRAQSDAQR